MPDAAYKSYTEYNLDIGDAAFTFFTDKGAISDSAEENASLHSHEFCELFYVSKGEIEIKTSENVYLLKEKDAALIPVGTVHQTKASHNCQRIVISFVCSKRKNKSPDGFYGKYRHLTEGEVIIFRDFAGADSFRRFARYYYGNYGEKRQLILSCLHEIVVLTKEYATQKEYSREDILPDSTIYRNYIIADYISANYGEGSLKELAKTLHLSCQQTHRIIKSIYKKTFSRCINEEKMKNALLMVQTTTLPFGEISAMLGYKCVHSFFSAFKKHFGKTPGTVRIEYSETT